MLSVRRALVRWQDLHNHPGQTHNLAVGVETVVVSDRAAPRNAVHTVAEAVSVLVVSGLLEALGRDVDIVICGPQVPRQSDVLVALPEVCQGPLALSRWRDRDRP